MASIAFALAGCAPAPAPSPTPTAFASEEEAFAAAENTFRMYADASNGTELSDPKSFPPVYDWLVGDALATARENYSQFYAAGITRTGASTFDTFTPVAYLNDVVTVHLCLDVSKVELVNADGTSAVPADRPPRQPIEVQFVSARTNTALAISSTVATEAIRCD